MLSLKDFNATKLSDTNQRNVKGGQGTETAGGDNFFGYGTSTCDWNDGNGHCTYYFDDPDRWRLSGDCK